MISKSIKMRVIIISSILLVFSTVAFSQDKDTFLLDSLSRLLESSDSEKETDYHYPEDSTSLLRYKEFEEASHKLDMAKYNFLRKQYKNHEDMLAYKKKVFYWQFISSVIIFFVVILIVIAGIYFAGKQFWLSVERVKERTQANSETDTQTTVKISASGLEIQSSLIGLMILVISIAFFYLYLIHVYPIEESNKTFDLPRTESKP